MKNKKIKTIPIFYIIVTLITFLSLLLAIFARLSIINPISDFNSIEDIIIERQRTDETLDSLEECKNELQDAQIIIIGKFNGERESKHYSTLSTIEVEQIIKGEEYIDSKYIDVHENNAFAGYKSQLCLRNFTVNNFMQEEKSYLLFLNKLEDFDEYYKQVKNIKNNQFVMASYYCTCFCLEETDSEVLDLDSLNIVDYNSYKNSEFIVFTNMQKKALYEFKEEIINSYINEKLTKDRHQ